jgi:hypothetical protein
VVSKRGEQIAFPDIVDGERERPRAKIGFDLIGGGMESSAATVTCLFDLRAFIQQCVVADISPPRRHIRRD